VEGIGFAHLEELWEKFLGALIPCIDGISRCIKPLLHHPE
jgi:hypothetical protein